MREIGSVADDFDIGAVRKSTNIHITSLWNVDFCEVGAMTEPPVSYLRHRWRYGDAREAGATRESTAPNIRHRRGDDSILTSSYQRIALRMDYGIAVLSRVIDLIVLGNDNAREAGATREGTVPNLRHRWWDGNACKAGATFESAVANLSHRWWDGDSLET